MRSHFSFRKNFVSRISPRCAFVITFASACMADDFKLLGNFGKNLGLFDISADGAMVVLEEPLFRERLSCQLRPCNAYHHRIVVKNALDRTTMAEAKIAFEGFQKIAIAFAPNREELLLRGRVTGLQEKPGMFFLWSPKTKAIQTIDLPASIARLEFVRMFEKDQILGRLGQKLVLWNWRTGDVRDITSNADVQLLAAEPFDKGVLAKLGITESEFRTDLIRGGALSSDGNYLALVIAEVPRKFFPERAQITPITLSVYDLRQKRRLFRQSMFEKEIREDEAINHVAGQVQFSPSGNAVAISYERQKPGFLSDRVNREARWAVYAVPSGNLLGVAQHPSDTVVESQAAVSPAAAGQLRFSPDGRYLYTTTTDTRLWKVQ